jgi:ABC-type multidrug transport system fused ATPase/permease subunit
MRRNRTDRELEQYRNLLETPTEFVDGFGWTTVAGVLFCGLIMIPGSLYLSLMTGGSMGAAATWVTLILFSEVARRALRTLSKQELVVLLHAAGGILGGGFLFGDFVYRAYLVSSEAVRDAGMRDAFPPWFVPPANSPAILERNLFHADWTVPISLLALLMAIGFVQKYSLGYFFFRLTSDIERLPFPMAPIQAQGAMALAEHDQELTPEGGEDAGRAAFMRARRGERKQSERWRLFSLGIVLGLAFGAVQVGIPAVSGLLLDKPIFLIPQPFLDTTALTESILPATPTGLVVDLGVILLGFVLPFWAVIGTAAAIVATVVANPLLHHAGALTRWQAGMDTINTTFANSMDFWMSFGIGSALAIAVISLYQTVRDVRRRVKELAGRPAEASARRSLWATPRTGRGDYSLWLALAGYVVVSVGLMALCYALLKDTGTSRIGLLLFLCFFTFVYNPLISYVNARLLGISGQSADIPFVKETAFIVSGAKGVEVWLAPIPITNYGGQAQGFRVNELTGVSFRSLIKADLLLLPFMFCLSLAFWGFIWHAAPIPSDAFPAAQINWELRTKTDTLLYTSTFAPDQQTAHSILDSEFMQAIHPRVIGTAFGLTAVLFVALSIFGLPTMFIYGIIRGLGALPHTMALEIVGALVGRYYYQKRFGPTNFLRMAPTLLAGYFTGVGLISMATIAMRLAQSAVSAAPF